MRELQPFIRVKVEKNTSMPYFAGYRDMAV